MTRTPATAKITPGNRKLGRIPNVSLSPIKACRACFGGKAPPCAKTCYALKAFRMYPDTQACWNHNFEEAKRDLLGFMRSIVQQIQAKRQAPRWFRWHVAGDILSREYLAGMVYVARECPNTKFLVFTKQHAIVNDYYSTELLFVKDRPANLTIIFSAWPGLPLVNPIGFPVAWMRPAERTGLSEPRIPANALECPGHCDTCGACWGLKRDVVFDQH